MNDRWQQRGDRSDDDARRGSLVVGLLLVLLGIFFLASEQLRFDVGRDGWPIFVIAPGVFLLLVGLAIPHEGGLGAAIPGGIITTVGLILAAQAATDTYASWAYAWALVAPGSVGATLTLYGLLHRRWDLLDAGLRTAAVGLGLFIGFGLFFENVVGIDEGSRTTALRNAMPVLAVGLGIVIVIMNVLPRRSREGGYASDASNRTEPPAPPAAG
ncbi:MAG: hypothetical protein ABSC46_05470 [Candidatus Limnocylindrales bacterium]|jgi:hypothetical protein